MNPRSLLAAIALMMCVVETPALVRAQVITELTVTERANVERKSEPVTNGIPLPQGLIKDGFELGLKTADGKDLPAAFTVTNKWPADGSARWVLLDTQLDVPAGGELKLQMVKRVIGYSTYLIAAPPGKLDVKDAADSITVDTGAVKFTVSKKSFRLFESLFVGKQDVLEAPAGGLTMTVDGKTFTSAQDANPAVSVEEKNEMRVAVLAAGKLTDKDGKAGFDYQVRIHAYRNSPLIKVVATVIKKYGTRRAPAHVSDLSLEFKVRSTQSDGTVPRQYTFGTDGAKPAVGQIGPKESACVWVNSSDSYTVSSVKDPRGQGGKCKSVKPLTLGWGDVSELGDKEALGIAAGVRRFWENFPKAIEAVNGHDVKLIVHLYPSMEKNPVDIYAGMARTHEVLLVPHIGKMSPEDLQAKFVAFQRPLYALASPKWYCRDSGGLGLLAEAADVNPTLYGDRVDQVKAFDKKMTGVLETLAGSAQDDWHGRGGVVMDAYGWLAYGDTLHYVWLPSDDPAVTQPTGSPWTIAWDSNYYDMPHVALAHFARTGKAAFFDFFVDHSWHLMDVDVVHWDPMAPNGGGSRRCPATNHVGFDPPEHADPTVNFAFDHHKSESLFERYYFLGDRFALSTAMELLGHAFDPVANGGKDGSYDGTRKPAHQVITLVAGYWCTGDAKYLDKARKVIAVGLERQKKFDGGLNADKAGKPIPAFTDGILSESWSKYYLAKEDKDVLAGVIALDDFLVAQKFSKWGNPAMGMGLGYLKTGEQKYADAGFENLTSKPQHLGKDSADMFRNAANFLGLFVEKIEAKKTKP